MPENLTNIYFIAFVGGLISAFIFYQLYQASRGKSNLWWALAFLNYTFSAFLLFVADPKYQNEIFLICILLYLLAASCLLRGVQVFLRRQDGLFIIRFAVLAGVYALFAYGSGLTRPIFFLPAYLVIALIFFWGGFMFLQTRFFKGIRYMVVFGFLISGLLYGGHLFLDNIVFMPISQYITPAAACMVSLGLLFSSFQSINSDLLILQAAQKENEKKLRDNKNKVESLHDIALELEQCQTEEEVWGLTVKAALDILKFSYGIIGLVEGEWVRVKASLPVYSQTDFRLAGSIAEKNITTGATTVINDLQEDARVRSLSEEFRSGLSIPIGDFGVFQAVSEHFAAFSPEDVEMAELLIAHVTTAIRRIWGELELQASNEKYRQLFEVSPVPLCEANFAGVKKCLDDLKAIIDLRSYLQSRREYLIGLADLVNIIDVNQATLKLYGKESKEEILAGLNSLFSREAYGSFLDILLFIAAGEKNFSIEQTHITIEGRKIDVQLYWSVAPGFEDYSRVFMSIVDITASKRAKEAIYQSGIQLNAILESTADGILAVNNKGKAIMLNERFIKLWLIPPELVESNGENIFQFVAQQLKKPTPFLNKTRMLCTEEAEESDTLYCKDGRVFECYSLPLIQNGRLAGRVWSFSDVTDKRKTEDLIQKTKLKLEKLHDTALKLSKARREKEVYDQVMEATVNNLEYAWWTFALVEGDMLEVKATTKPTKQDIPITSGIAGKTFRTGETILLDNIQEVEDARPASTSYKAGISTPVGNIGVMQVISTKEGGFSQEDVKMVELLANHAAEAIQRIRSEAHISYMSYHDTLTGLYNRAFLEQELRRLDTERQLPISIIMCDINGLKLVNDAYGHNTGDELLISAARNIIRACREEDIIARWGGDEFIILLPQTLETEAEKICGRIIKEGRKTKVKSVPISMAMGIGCKESMDVAIFETLKSAETRMYRNKLAESRSTRNAVLSALVKALGEKSYETEAHSHRMKEKALKIGKRIGLLQEELDRLALLVSLHDIGKITIAQEILNKPGSLTEEEWEIIKRHPETGYRIARSTEEIAHVAEDILAHHEWWDGTGYPQGLKGKEIPILARITTIVDAFEVMTQGRPYKAPMSKDEVIAEIRRCAGRQFDPDLVEVFLGLSAEGEI